MMSLEERLLSSLHWLWKRFVPERGWWRGVIFNPSFWLVAVMFTVVTVIHYRDAVYPVFFTDVLAKLGLGPGTLERILYLIVIILASFLFRGWEGLVVAIAALICMLPNAVLKSVSPFSALLEVGVVTAVGCLVALGVRWFRKEYQQRLRLVALNYVSNTVSQSLELEQILESSISSILDVMDVDAVLIFLLDRETGGLRLRAYRGVSDTFVKSVDGLKIGEGLNGTVALTGLPALIKDAARDPRVTKAVVKEEGIHSQVIVPMKSKGKVMGTLSVAMRRQRKFLPEEVELLVAIGGQIGVAVENANLYDEQRKLVEQLRASEEKFRQIFENAHDAIWIHDMEGNLVSGNAAAARLTGYRVDELVRMNVRAFLSDEGLNLAREIRSKLLQGQSVPQPYEQKLLTKAGTEAVLKLTTNLITKDGKPVGFQHIARDVTQEKKLQESLRFYLSQITKAQEEERKRIARELHDETIQSLVVLTRQIDEIVSGDRGISEYKKILLESLRDQIESIIQDVRRLSQDLRPPALDTLGLIPALEGLAADIEKHSGININVKVCGAVRRFSSEVELIFFRIVQEALRNVWRHSGATSAEVIVEFDTGETRITIRDNGKGFRVPDMVGELLKDGRMGLAGMQERVQLLNGSLSVESQSGKGTTVTVKAPL
jgi:PAS domain S-box-containing protein